MLSEIHAITIQPACKSNRKKDATIGYKQVEKYTLSGKFICAFYSMALAAKAAGYSPSTFRRKLRGGRATFRGFKWVRL